MIRICDDAEQLSRSAAELFVEQAQQAVAARGRFCVALAGGSTPERCYQLLAKPPLRELVPWAKTHVFWGDERCVPDSDPRSNARMAHAALLDQVPLPAAQIHLMACAENPAAAAQTYAALLQDFFPRSEPRFDLVLLGLGEDGHTASLFPETPALREKVRLVVPVQKPGEDFARLTLSAPAINSARLVVFLVSGKNKAAILSEILEGPSGRFPAQLITPVQGELLWLVDRAAIGQVPL